MTKCRYTCERTGRINLTSLTPEYPQHHLAYRSDCIHAVILVGQVVGHSQLGFRTVTNFCPHTGEIAIDGHLL